MTAEDLGKLAVFQGEFGPTDGEDDETPETGEDGSWAASQNQGESQGTPSEREGPA